MLQNYISTNITSQHTCTLCFFYLKIHFPVLLCSVLDTRSKYDVPANACFQQICQYTSNDCWYVYNLRKALLVSASCSTSVPLKVTHLFALSSICTDLLVPHVAKRDANTLIGEITSSANAVYKYACTCSIMDSCWCIAVWGTGSILLPGVHVIYLMPDNFIWEDVELGH